MGHEVPIHHHPNRSLILPCPDWALLQVGERDRTLFLVLGGTMVRWWWMLTAKTKKTTTVRKTSTFAQPVFKVESVILTCFVLCRYISVTLS